MNKNSGARLELKKVNKQSKEAKIQQSPLKPVIEQKSKQKNKNDKAVKNDKVDVADDKDKTSKKKDKKGKDEQKQDQKLEKSADKKGKKEKEQKQDKKDKKDKKEKEKKQKKDKKKDKNRKDQKSLTKQQDKNESSKKKRQDKQLQTLNNIHNSENKAKMTIQQLIEQYKAEAERLLFHNHGYDPDKQKAIQQQLQNHQKSKQKRHQRLEMLQEKKQEIEKSKQKAKQMKMQLRRQKLHQKKIKRVQQKLSSIQISAQQRRRDYQKFIQYVKERKKFKPRFKRYQQQYEQYMRQQQQDYRDKLDELSRKYQPMNPAQMINFQQNYMAQKEQGLHYRENKLKLQQDLIKEENERRQKLLWKGNCHRNVNQQYTQRLKKKRQPWQKLETIKQYGKFIAENLKRQKQEAPQEQKQNDQQQQTKKQKLAYHQKYIKGVNYGLVPYEKPSPLSLQQKVKKGNQYLQQIKQMNKHRKNKTVDYSNNHSSRKLSASDDLKKDSKTFRLKRRSNPYYPSQQNKKQIDFKNYESIQFTIQKLNALKKDRELNDQIVKHGQYASILDIQERKRRGGSMVVKQINQKLNLLKKL